MIEIGKNFLWEIARTKQRTQQEKERNKLGITQAQQQADALQQEYEEKMKYLFRTATEKTQLAYENARKQLAVLQAKRAANGVTNGSASVIDEKQLAKLQSLQQEQKTQTSLQQTASQETNIFERKWNELREAVARFRKQAHRKNGLGSLGRAIVSLFN